MIICLTLFIIDENGEYQLDENGNKISVLDVPIEGGATLRQILEKIGRKKTYFYLYQYC